MLSGVKYLEFKRSFINTCGGNAEKTLTTTELRLLVDYSIEGASSEAYNFLNFMDYYNDSSKNPFAVMLQKREQKEEKKKRIK